MDFKKINEDFQYLINKALANACGVADISVTESLEDYDRAPKYTYIVNGQAKVKQAQCLLVKWTLHDQRKFFAWIEPELKTVEVKPKYFLGFLVSKGAYWQEIDQTKTNEKIIEFVRNCVANTPALPPVTTFTPMFVFDFNIESNVQTVDMSTIKCQHCGSLMNKHIHRDNRGNFNVCPAN